MSSTLRPENIPADVLPPILEHLLDRRDLHNCALVCRAFNRAATPILYRTMDSRLVRRPSQRPRLLHPFKTLLRKPEYATYVRDVREMGAVGYAMPEVIPECQQALRLCVNVSSFSWVDDSANGANNEEDLLAYIDILRGMRVHELTIRTYVGLSETAWDALRQLTGLRKVAIWCMEGQPRVLQGWSQSLGSSLTHLELGRCAGVPASILVSVLSHLPLLQNLRLKGAPSNAIPEILTLLPNLVTLDTEYFGSGLTRYVDDGVPLASLKELTVRTSSVDIQGPQQLWAWIRRLLPRPSLESFTLNAFSIQGQSSIPRPFLLDLAATHGATLKQFIVATAELTLEDVQCLCKHFPHLEVLSCSIAWCQNQTEIGDAIGNAHNLRKLTMHVNWITPLIISDEVHFDMNYAKELMLRDHSRLRVIGMGHVLYTGRWVQEKLDDGSKNLEFKVSHDVAKDTWI